MRMRPICTDCPYNCRALSMLICPPSKTKWKRLLNDEVHIAVEAFCKSDIKNKPSLKYVNPDFLKVGRIQNQNCLLVIRPKTIIHQDLSIGELVPSPHKRNRRSN